MCVRKDLEASWAAQEGIIFQPKGLGVVTKKPSATKNSVQQTNSVTKKSVIGRGRPRGVGICRKCKDGTIPGGSYCRVHETERVKEWRQKRKGQ